jgi:L-amino acid N-acyltransferase YncA
VDWARNQGEPTVYAAIAPTNAASIALVTRLGFRRTDTAPNSHGDEEYVVELP